MLNKSYCSGMRLGSSEISIDGLKQLASFGANQARGACSLPSRKRENVMQNWQHQSCDQLVLELERQNRQVPVFKNVKGLLETLVDLLLDG